MYIDNLNYKNNVDDYPFEFRCSKAASGLIDKDSAHEISACDMATP